MKTFINLTFAGLLLSCTPAAQSTFEGAEWIGTDEIALNAQYLAEFSVSYDVTPNDAEQSVFYFGGNDERLMSRNLNHMGVENKAGEIYLALAFSQDQVSVSRRGYEADGKDRELQTLPLSASKIATSVISGISKPSRRRLIPTRTSKTSRRKSRIISARSIVSISECSI